MRVPCKYAPTSKEKLSTQGQYQYYSGHMSPKFMLKSANREVVPKSAGLSWQRLDRRLEHGIPFNWHHHPEMELTLTLNCKGQRFVGDNVSGFGDGDLALVGANLPHTWVSQERIDPAKQFAAVAFAEHSQPRISTIVKGPQRSFQCVGGNQARPVKQFGRISDFFRREFRHEVPHRGGPNDSQV